MGASALGSAQKLLELSIDYAKQRVQFGRAHCGVSGSPDNVADMATQDLCRPPNVFNHAACLRDAKGESVIKEASMVKLFCTEMANRVADMAVQDTRWYGIHEGLSCGALLSRPATDQDI